MAAGLFWSSGTFHTGTLDGVNLAGILPCAKRNQVLFAPLAWGLAFSSRALCIFAFGGTLLATRSVACLFLARHVAWCFLAGLVAVVLAVFVLVDLVASVGRFLFCARAFAASSLLLASLDDSIRLVRARVHTCGGL